MSNSSDQRTLDLELSPEDLLIYEGLVDPDEPREPELSTKMEYTQDVQRMMLGALLQDFDLARHYASVMRPGSFTALYHSVPCRILFDYIQKYDALPSRAILNAEIRVAVAKQPDAECVLAYLVEADLARKDLGIELDGREYVRDKLDRFLKKDAIYNLLHAASRAAKDPNADLDAVMEKLRNFKPPAQAAANPGRFLMTIKDARARAALRPQVPFIPNYAEFGALTLLSGQPGCGKSELIIMMVYCSLSGIPFLGMDIPKSHFVLFDPENLLTTTIQRMDALFGTEVADGLENWVTIVDKDAIGFPQPLTPEFVEGIIVGLREQVGDEKIVVVIDTFRTAFSGAADYDENGPEFVSRQLGGVKAVAGRTFASIIMLHHNNWSGRASGTTAFRGNADYACEYKREQGLNKAILQWVRGRGCEMQADLTCVRNPITKHITLDLSYPVEDDRERQDRHEIYERNVIVGACPVGQENAMSKADICKAVKRNCDFIRDQSMGIQKKPMVIGKSKVSTAIDWLVEGGYLFEVEAANKNHTKYYRLESVDLMAEFYPNSTPRSLSGDGIP
jgi:hypothetical protein